MVFGIDIVLLVILFADLFGMYLLLSEFTSEHFATIVSMIVYALVTLVSMHILWPWGVI